MVLGHVTIPCWSASLNPVELGGSNWWKHGPCIAKGRGFKFQSQREVEGLWTSNGLSWCCPWDLRDGRVQVRSLLPPSPKKCLLLIKLFLDVRCPPQATEQQQDSLECEHQIYLWDSFLQKTPLSQVAVLAMLIYWSRMGPGVWFKIYKEFRYSPLAAEMQGYNTTSKQEMFMWKQKKKDLFLFGKQIYR